MAINPLNYVGVGDVGSVANNCTAQAGALIAQCNDYAGFVLVVGLVIGMIAGIAGVKLGEWYNGRKK